MRPVPSSRATDAKRPDGAQTSGYAHACRVVERPTSYPAPADRPVWLTRRKVREVVSDSDEIGVGELAELDSHGAGVADARAGLVLAHRFQQIVLALIRQAGYFLSRDRRNCASSSDCAASLGSPVLR